LDPVQHLLRPAVVSGAVAARGSPSAALCLQREAGARG
jgi:hypothetical protein